MDARKTASVDGKRRRRFDPRRKDWYAWWRQVRFARHMLGTTVEVCVYRKTHHG